MKTRTLLELYEILLEYSEKNGFETGICLNIDDMWYWGLITAEELFLLINDFEERIEGLTYKSGIKRDFLKGMKKAEFAPRIELLKSIVNELKSNQNGN